MCRYENFVGLTEVKAAQARVVECEKKFIEIQEMRREAQKMISDVRKRIKVRPFLVLLLISNFNQSVVYRIFTWSLRRPTGGRIGTWS